MSVSRVADNFYAIRLARLMNMEFIEWPAYKLGIIDAKGKVLKKARTEEEKKVWTRFHIAVRNIKRIAHKVPGFNLMLKMGGGFLLLKEIAHDYGLNPENFITEVDKAMKEAMVAGDHGYDAGSIAKGETSGAITNVGPEVAGKDKKKKKKRVKSFSEFAQNG